jgi:hypothetical protein
MSPPPIPPGAAVGTATAPARSGGGNALKIILMILGGMFLIAVLVVGAGVFFVKKKIDQAKDSIQTDSAGNVTSMDTPFGKLEASQDAEKILKDLDIPLYPNAKQAEGGTSSMTINNTTISNVQLESSDSMEQVMEFYKGLYPDANIMDTPESKMISLGEQDKRMLIITISKNEITGMTGIHIANTEKR